MRISDWSSDVCSSDLFGAALDEIETVLNILGIVSFDKTDCTREESRVVAARAAGLELVRQWKIRKAERVRPMLAADIGLAVLDPSDAETERLKAHVAFLKKEIGRETCRERVCQYW